MSECKTLSFIPCKFPFSRLGATGGGCYSAVRPQQRSIDRAPSDMLLSFAVWAAPRQSPLPWSDVNLLIVTDVHSWVAAHPHTDHT